MSRFYFFSLRLGILKLKGCPSSINSTIAALPYLVAAPQQNCSKN